MLHPEGTDFGVHEGHGLIAQGNRLPFVFPQDQRHFNGLLIAQLERLADSREFVFDPGRVFLPVVPVLTRTFQNQGSWDFLRGNPLNGQRIWQFTRDQLMDVMYTDYPVVSERAVDTHIKNLRKKFSKAGDGMDLIESVFGHGYRFRS